MLNRRHLCLPWIAAAVIVALACSPSVPPPSPEELLAGTRDAMGGVHSYHFAAVLTGQTDDGVQQTQITGEWASPDRYRMRMEPLGRGAGHVQEIVSVGGRVLASDSDYQGGAWTEQRSVPPSGLSGRSFVPELDDTTLLEDEVIDGLAVYHLAGTSMSEFSEGIPAPVNTYDLYIGKENMLLQRLVIETDFSGFAESAPSNEDSVPTSQRATYDFYDYHQPVRIELPELGGQ